MTELSPEARALIDDASRAEGPTAVQRARLHRRLIAQIGAGAAVSTGAVIGAASTTGATAGGASFAVSAATKLVVIVALAGSVGAGGIAIAVHQQRHASAVTASARSAPPSSPPFATAPSTTAMAPPHNPPAPWAAPTAVPSQLSGGTPPRYATVATATQPTPAPSVSESPSSLDSETRLLRDADFELRAGHPDDALALLDRHAALFPHGTLVEERMVERILVLCTLGRGAEAEAEGALFLRERPRSLLGDRVRASCATGAR